MTEEVIKKLNKIADDYVMGTTNKKRFKVFARQFWGNRSGIDVPYVDDWVKRFNRGDEYIYADSIRLKILVERVDGITAAKRIARKQFENAGWNKAYVDERVEALSDLGR